LLSPLLSGAIKEPAGAHDRAVRVVREFHPRWRLAGCGVLFGPLFII
jgi:hypothetical protein